MKITFKGDYALKVILDLALESQAALVQMKDLAKRQDIPKKFLEQIVLLLKGAKYIKTIRGPRGGIVLAKDPARITLGEIIRLIEGPTSPIACVSTTGYAQCNFENDCVLRDVFLEVKNRVNEVVDRTTFADLTERMQKIRQAKAAHYSI